VSAGLFDPRLAQDIQTNIFNGYPLWPSLVTRVATVLLMVVFLLAAVVQVFAVAEAGRHINFGYFGHRGACSFYNDLQAAFDSAQAWGQIAAAGHRKADYRPRSMCFLVSGRPSR